MTIFGVIAIVGWAGAVGFMLLFMLHKSTRSTLRDARSRMFWLFIVADSAVMVMIYTTALLNLFLHEWPLKDAFRTLLGISALIVVYWRIALFISLNIARRKKAKENAQ